MKRLLDKLRWWLIKKLGGYDRQQVITQRVDVHQMNVRPIMVRAEVRISRLDIDMNSGTDYFAYCKNRLMHELSAKIQESEFALLQSADDPVRHESVMRATAYLVHPKDAAKMSYGLF